MTHLLQTVAELEARGVGFRSLTEAIDTTTTTGLWIGMEKGVWRVFGAAESSRRYISAIFTGGCPWHLEWIDGRSCPED